MTNNDIYIIPFGFRCTTCGILKKMGLKKESYPFDWLISNLNVIRHCIESNFKEFLNKEYYISKITETSDYCENNKIIVAYENIIYNKYYENYDLSDKLNTYTFNLAMNHHNITLDNDYQYYKRCIERFLYSMVSNNKKLYLHIGKVLYEHEYNIINNNIINDFITFHNFIETQTNNISGLFFIIVKYNNITNCEIECLKYKEKSYSIYLIKANHNLMDTGEIFMGQHTTEEELIINEINKILSNM